MWGKIVNALSSQNRDTANLTADLWPRPRKDGVGQQNGFDTNNKSKKDKIDPVLIACADDGEPFCLDPKTMQTMVIPGDKFGGNSKMEFLEFDEQFDLVSRREH